MYDLTRSGKTSEEIQKLLRSDRTITYMAELLDKDERTKGTVNITGGYVDFNSDAKIKRCASINVVDASNIDFISDKIKLYEVLITEKERIMFPLGVFLLNSPSRQAGDGIVSREIECYDKTQILEDDKFTTRYAIQEGTNYITAAVAICSSAGIDYVNYEASDKVTFQTIEFSVGTSKLDAINQLLAAVNYNEIYADANGILQIRKYIPAEARKIEMYYMTDAESVVCSGAEETLDTFSAPNKVVRYLENAEREYLYSEVVNDDVNSKLSTVNRGRVIVDIEKVDDVADQATLDALTRRVAEEKKIYQYVSFESATIPNHEYRDCIYLDNKELDISGKYIETAWRITLKSGGTMSHTCRKAVYL